LINLVLRSEVTLVVVVMPAVITGRSDWLC